MSGSSLAPGLPARLIRSAMPWRPGSKAIRLVAIGLLALLASALLTNTRPSRPDGIPVIERAVFLPLEAGGAVGNRAAAEVALPHRCPPKTGTAGCAGLYRTVFRHDGPPPKPATGEPPLESWSVYIPTYSGRLIVRVNGEFVIDSRRVKSDAVINQAGPLLALIPASLLREGDNALEIEMAAWSRVGGFLDVLFVGPDAALRKHHQQRQLLLETLPGLLVAWQAALGLALLVVWVGHRREMIHLTMSLLMGLGCVQGIPLFITESDWPDWVGRGLNLAGAWQATFLPVMISQLVGRRLPMARRWLILPPAVLTTVFLLTLLDPPVWQPRFFTVWVVVLIPWVLWITGWSIWAAMEASFRRNDAAAQLVLAAFLVAAIMMIYDILAFTGIIANSFPLLGRFLPPLLSTTISAILMWRFAMALGEVSRFNGVLRQEVTAAEDALRASFQREQAHSRAVALDSERRRLTRDLHDGLAGQLVSIVAQCELPNRDFGRISQAARMALEDLRLVIASMDDVGDDLAMMLALFHERIGPQLQAQGVELDWRMVALPEIEGLRSEHALALFRILQEAVTNAVRHSGCRTVTIGMQPSELPGYAVRITVSDQGKGGVPRSPSAGRGLRNMRSRAAGLGAAFLVESGGEGTRVVLDLPRVLPGTAAG